MASYVCGTADTALLYQTIAGLFNKTVAAHPDHEAVVSCEQDIRLSYGELHNQAAALAGGLLALGFQPGDRIGIWSGNCAEWVIALFGTALANIILVPINPDYRAQELAYALNKVGIKGLIMAPGYKKSQYGKIFEEAAGAIAWQEGRLTAQAFPSLEHVFYIGQEGPAYARPFHKIHGLATAKTADMLAKIVAATQPDDPINIQFTSGTTGRPKGATLSHYNLINNAYLTVVALRLKAGDRMCVPVPLYHCFGLVLGVIAAMVARATLVLPAQVFDPLTTLKAVARERCVSLYSVPTMFIAQLNHPSFADYDLSCLRTGIIGGAPCPIEVVRRLVSDMHLEDLIIAFGMTETSPVSFLTKIGDPLELRVETVGQVLPYLEAKIVSGGQVVPRGAVGEILVRGHAVMIGYWNDPEATAEAIADGWMHTGDLGVLDENGYLRITGRVKDMIIRGGENIYPREIEEFLFQHPEVLSAQVFGIPSEYFGEEVCAWLILKDGAAITHHDIKQYCLDRIARYKVPEHIHFVEAFPLTVTGKPQKFVMRDLMMELLKQ